KHGSCYCRPPFPRFRAGAPCGEGILEVQELRELTILLFNGLGEIDRFGILLQDIDALLRYLRHIDRGSFLEFEDGYCRVHELLQGLADVFVLDGLMADIKHDTNVPPQGIEGFRDRDPCKLREAGGRGSRIEMLGEVIDGLVRCFKETKRFRFQGEADRASRTFADVAQSRRHSHDVLRELRDDIRSGHTRLEGKRRALYRG